MGILKIKNWRDKNKMVTRLEKLSSLPTVDLISYLESNLPSFDNALTDEWNIVISPSGCTVQVSNTYRYTDTFTKKNNCLIKFTIVIPLTGDMSRYTLICDHPRKAKDYGVYSHIVDTSIMWLKSLV
jgi:hypothetical protein